MPSNITRITVLLTIITAAVIAQRVMLIFHFEIVLNGYRNGGPTSNPSNGLTRLGQLGDYQNHCFAYHFSGFIICSYLKPC